MHSQVQGFHISIFHFIPHRKNCLIVNNLLSEKAYDSLLCLLFVHLYESDRRFWVEMLFTEKINNQ